MTQKREDAGKISELNTLFLALDDRGQDSALTILRALGFAQSVMYPVKATTKQPNQPSDKRSE